MKMTRQIMEKLDLNDLKKELEGQSVPSYACKRMFGLFQIKINEIIKKLNELEEKRGKKPLPKYIIEESHKYAGCFNIYDKRTGSRVKYFVEDDDLNYKRATEWVLAKTKEENKNKRNNKNG